MSYKRVARGGQCVIFAPGPAGTRFSTFHIISIVPLKGEATCFPSQIKSLEKSRKNTFSRRNLNPLLFVDPLERQKPKWEKTGVRSRVFPLPHRETSGGRQQHRHFRFAKEEVLPEGEVGDHPTRGGPEIIAGFSQKTPSI